MGFWDRHRERLHSGISWNICKQSTPCSRQATTPAPRQSSFFTSRMLFPMHNWQHQSTEGLHNSITQTVRLVPRVSTVACWPCTLWARCRTDRTCEYRPPSESLPAAAAAGTVLCGCVPPALQTVDFCITFYTAFSLQCCLQCFDAVGWVAGRASGL